MCGVTQGKCQRSETAALICVVEGLDFFFLSVNKHAALKPVPVSELTRQFVRSRLPAFTQQLVRGLGASLPNRLQ